MVGEEESNPRLAGVIVLIAGAVLSYFGYYQPLVDIHSGVPEVRLSAKAAFGAPVFLGFGLVYLILGKTASRLFGKPKELSAKGFLLIIPLVILAFLAKGWLDSQVALAGYQ